VNPRALLGSVVAIALVFPATSHAQAAAESALTNALTSSTTVKAGSTLNHALRQSTTQLGIHIQEQTSGAVRVGVPQQIQGAPRIAMKSTTTRSASGAAVRSGSSPALGGISVQGGETVCTSVGPPLASPPNQVPADKVPARSSPGMSNPGMSNPGIPNPGMSNPGMSTPGIATASVDCRGRNSARDSATVDKYKSFVTLPLPK